MRRLRRIIAIVVVLVIWQGTVRRPTPIAEGDGLPVIILKQMNVLQPTIRVASFNIAGGVSPETNRLDLRRTADCVEDFNIIGMQEVHGAWFFEHNQAQTLGQMLQMPWLFAPSERQWGVDAFGNGALCDLPVTHWRRVPLSMSLQSSNRSLLYLTAAWHGRPLTVLITHLDRHVDHEAELGAVLAAFADAKPPAILMGDLNMVEPDARFTAMRNDPAVIDAIGQMVGPKLDPLNYDWIFAKGLRCKDGGLKDTNGASDHPLAWAEFEEP